MKAFFTWLIIQLLFARMLFGLMLELWATFKLPADQVVYFIVIICSVETIASAVLLYSIWLESQRRR